MLNLLHVLTAPCRLIHAPFLLHAFPLFCTVELLIARLGFSKVFYPLPYWRFPPFPSHQNKLWNNYLIHCFLWDLKEVVGWVAAFFKAFSRLIAKWVPMLGNGLDYLNSLLTVVVPVSQLHIVFCTQADCWSKFVGWLWYKAIILWPLLVLNAAISKCHCKVKKHKTGLEILGFFYMKE